MGKIQSLSGAIRNPFEVAGNILNFLMRNIIYVIIFCLILWFVYWFFSKGIYKRFRIFFKKDKLNNQEVKNGQEKNS